MKVAIGICTKNEESSIISMLDSLMISILKDSNSNDFFILFCANGCSDQTIPLIKGWQNKNSEISSRLFILDEGNLIEAQRLIIKESKKLKIENIIFLDADIIVDENCIGELLKNSPNSEIKASYAVSVPIQREKQTFVEKALNLYDSPNKLFSERKHLHGRTFFIKTEAWNIPKTIPKLVADDIYLSFYFLEKFGYKSIKKIPTAKVFFNQVRTYKDFYNSLRRRSIEIDKCFAIFPSFKNLPKDQVNRVFLWKRLIKEPFADIFWWIYLIVLKKIIKIQFKVESFFGVERNNQWKVTKTSKKFNLDKKPTLILIEGLDCSGKKTTSRMLQNKLIDNGISCVINIGPLNSKIYRLISRVVSLHSFPNFFRSFVYAFDGIGESGWYKNFNSEVVIQISSPMRNWAYAIENKKYIRLLISKFIEKRLPKYDKIYFLTVSYEERLERHFSQVAHKENPDKLINRFSNRQSFDRMEDKLKKIIRKKYKIEKEFNTTELAYEEIVEFIVENIDTHI